MRLRRALKRIIISGIGGATGRAGGTGFDRLKVFRADNRDLIPF